jgi:aspartate carbamoyltransferase regulatory subunit
MKDIVIVKSKTINNESVPVVLKLIEPFTGEAEEREITRSVIFKDFQAEVSIKIARSLVKMNPDEFSIVEGKSDLSKAAERIVRVSKEKSEGFKCQYCGAESKSKAGLTAHIRYNHPDKWEGKKTVKTEVKE